MQTLLGLVFIGCGAIFVNYIATFKPPANNQIRIIHKSISNPTVKAQHHNINLPKPVKYRKARNNYVDKAVNRLLYRIRHNPNAVQTVISACSYYGAPVDTCLTLWWLESSMGLGGDKGGAGGNLALQAIEKLTHPSNSRRWKRFKVNKRDLLAIANHCGFNAYTVQGSWTGALGPFQFMPATWIKVAIDGNGDNKACPLNLQDSAYGAAKYIRNLQRKSGSWNKAIQAYSGGSSAYMRRSILVRKHFCNIMQKSMQINLSCSAP